MLLESLEFFVFLHKFDLRCDQIFIYVLKIHCLGPDLGICPLRWVNWFVWPRSMKQGFLITNMILNVDTRCYPVVLCDLLYYRLFSWSDFCWTTTPRERNSRVEFLPFVHYLPASGLVKTKLFGHCCLTFSILVTTNSILSELHKPVWWRQDFDSKDRTE